MKASHCIRNTPCLGTGHHCPSYTVRPGPRPSLSLISSETGAPYGIQLLGIYLQTEGKEAGALGWHSLPEHTLFYHVCPTHLVLFIKFTYLKYFVNNYVSFLVHD